MSQNGRVSRYRAVVEAAGRLSGKQVVVYAFSNRDDQRFVDAVRFAKQTWYIKIALPKVVRLTAIPTVIPTSSLC